MSSIESLDQDRKEKDKGGARQKSDRQALTAKAIKAARLRPYVYRMFDTVVKGFHLVVSPSGGKSFSLQYNSPELHKRRFMKIGIYPTVSLADARKLAGKERELLDVGIDPLEERERLSLAGQAEEEAAAREMASGTVEQLFDFYIETLKARKARSWEPIQNIYKKNIHPYIGDMKAKDIEAQHITSVLARIHKRGKKTMAGHTQKYMRAAFKIAIQAKNDPALSDEAPDFGIQFNPVDQLPPGPQSEPGERFLSHDEIRRFWIEAGTVNMSRDMAVAAKLLLSTGQRVEEVLHATWDEFDIEKKRWTIPASRRKTHWKLKKKTKEPHIVPLTDFHIALLDSLPRGNRKYLFPDRSGKKARKSDALQQSIERYCKPTEESGRRPFEYFTPRDMRRTFKTTTGELKILKDTRDRIQGHAQGDISSKNYDRYSYLDEKREAMEIWTAWLADLVGVEVEKSNVIQLTAS